MNVIDLIRTADGGRAIDNLARSYGISRDEADKAIQAVGSLLADRIERNTLSRGGLADLIEALGDGRHDAYVNGQYSLNDARLVNDGNRILGHILGTKDTSRSVAARAAATSGLSESLIKMLLPIIAGMIMSGLGKSTQGGLGDILSKMGLPGFPGGGRPQPRSAPSGRGGGLGMPDLPQGPSGGGLPMPGETVPGGQGGGFGLPIPGGRGGTTGGWPTGGGAGLPMPDSDTGQSNWPFPSGGRSGAPQSQSPLPLPGDTLPGLPRNGDNPYGDLSDILRRGGFGGGRAPSGGGQQAPIPVPTNMGGGALWSIIRSVLGGALGFGNRGVMGWIVNFLIFRFGWRILRGIFGRMLPGGMR